MSKQRKQYTLEYKRVIARAKSAFSDVVMDLAFFLQCIFSSYENENILNLPSVNAQNISDVTCNYLFG